MLRLDPAHPPLWRDATCLQFGVADVARLDDPMPWELRLIDALGRGVADADLRALARAEQVDQAQLDALLADLAPVIGEVAPPPRLAVRGASDLPLDLVPTVADAMRRAGADVRVEAEDAAASDRVVVLVAAHLVAPHRAASLICQDRRHLPLVFDGGGATVGPLIEPGRTGCLACDGLHARDADPAWPLLASQLIGRGCRLDGDLAVEAARVAVQLITGREDDPPRSVRLRTDSPHRVWRAHLPHEDCCCRSLEGSETEPVRLAPAPETSSATAFARRA